jgi:methionyl-tRNA synthetase
MPYNSDGSVTYESVVARYNNDLANNLGNLVSRTHAMTKKYFDGVIPTPDVTDALDDDLKSTVASAITKSVELMNAYHVADSLDEIFSMLRRANKYIDETMPWALAKDESQKGRLATVIYNLLETIRTAAVLLTPYIPATAEDIFAQLGTDKKEFATVASFGALESGKALGEAHTLFQRIDEKAFLAEMEAKIAAAIEANKPVEEPEHEAEIGIESFGAVELRVAEILSAEPIPKAKKLLKLQVDLGYEKRQVVSGIAKFYTPDQLVGKKVCLVTNLKPAKLCGVDSFGMILASGEEDVKVVFLDPTAKNGDRIH